MEQNENIMDNGFEYFEEQRKYAAIDEKIEKQADKFAKVSQRILVIEAIEVFVGVVIPSMIFDSSFMNFFIGVTGTLVLISHLVSLRYAIAGYKMKKTKKTKETIFLHKVIPVICAVFGGGVVWMVYILVSMDRALS